MMRLLGGILIIAGTTIGAGTLALPVVTGAAGFGPSSLLFVAVWLLMTYSAYLIVEVNLSMERGVNLVTMARRTLGVPGEVIAWASYLLLLYTLTAAYISGSGDLVLEWLRLGFGEWVPSWVGPLPLVILLGFCIVAGIRKVDLLNRILMAGLAITFVMILGALLPRAEGALLERAAYLPLLKAAPVVLTSFGFHIVIPSLTAYFEGNVRRVRLCVLIGSLLPLLVYLLWQLALLGTLPLSDLQAMGRPAADVPHRLGLVSAGLFAFLIVATSLLGVLLSLWDFLADGLRLHHTHRGRLLLTLLTFVPPLLYAWFYPEGFIRALDSASIFVALLLGLLPIAMVWSERYIQRRTLPFRTPGGRPALIVAALLFCTVIVLEVVT